MFWVSGIVVPDQGGSCEELRLELELPPSEPLWLEEGIPLWLVSEVPLWPDWPLAEEEDGSPPEVPLEAGVPPHPVKERRETTERLRMNLRRVMVINLS